MDVVYLDFSKAFDKVPHARLFAILTAHGIGGEILLLDRGVAEGQDSAHGAQREGVVLATSDLGVPQGSVLGPTLAFINPFDKALEDLSGFVSKFADDTKVGPVVDTTADGEALQTTEHPQPSGGLGGHVADAVQR